MADFHLKNIASFLVASIFMVLDYLLLVRTWQGNILPKNLHFLLGLSDSRTIGLDLFSVFLALVILKIIVVMFTRVLTNSDVSYIQDPTLNTEGVFLKANINSLTNDIEQGLLFFVNLLAASTFSDFTPEKALVLTFLFIVGRALFWGGYILSAYTHSALRAPGMTLTLLTTASLAYFNLSHIF